MKNKIIFKLASRLIWACVIIRDLINNKLYTKSELKSILRQTEKFEEYGFKVRKKYEKYKGN